MEYKYEYNYRSCILIVQIKIVLSVRTVQEVHQAVISKCTDAHLHDVIIKLHIAAILAAVPANMSYLF